MNATQIRTVLYATGDQAALVPSRLRLEQNKFHVETAPDGLAALKLLTRLTPDLAVVDLQLPKLNGVDVLKYIRADARLKDTPVIMLSAGCLNELDKEPVLESANKRLFKTDCTPEILLENIEALLASARTGKGDRVKTRANGNVSSGTPVHNGIQTITAAAPVPPVPAGREEFLKTALNGIREKTDKIREHCCNYIKEPLTVNGQEHLAKLQAHVQLLYIYAQMHAEKTRIGILARAFHDLLSEVVSMPSRIPLSMLQTISQAADCVDQLLHSDDVETHPPRASVLIAGDDPLSNEVIVNGLKRADFDATASADPLNCLQMLEVNRYDLVLLNITMSHFDGFGASEKLHQLDSGGAAPIIFIIGPDNLQNRKHCVMSGADEFIALPVSPLEVLLKATVRLLRPRPPGTGDLRADRRPRPAVVPEKSGAPLPDASVPFDRTTNNETKNLDSERQLPPAVDPRGGQAHIGVVPDLSTTAAKHTCHPEISPQPSIIMNETIPPSNGKPPGNISPDLQNLGSSTSDDSRPAFDKVTQAATSLIFGTGPLPELNVRLVRIALEHYQVHELVGHQNRSRSANGDGGPASDKVAQAVTRLIFGTDLLPELNVRLVHIALEHYTENQLVEGRAAPSSTKNSN